MQAGYYVVSGLFPLVSMPAFEGITGPKVDKWLVQTVGLLAVCIGTSLFAGARRQEIDWSILTLAVTSAFSFASIDVVHAARRRISPAYLADAATEAAIIVMLLKSLRPS